MASGTSASLAVNLRRLRGRRGVSTAELARRAGVSRATVTQLEAGGGNPTLETLYALANALDAALAELIVDSPLDDPPRVVREREGVRVVGQAVEAWLVATVPGGTSPTEIYAFGVDGDAAQVSAAHPDGTREHLHVYSGRLRIGPTADPVEVAAGDFVEFRADNEHVYQRVGRSRVRGLLVITHGPG